MIVTRAPLELRRTPYSITTVTRTADDRARPGLALDDSRYVTSAIVNAFAGRYFEPDPGRSVYVGFTIGAGGGGAPAGPG